MGKAKDKKRYNWKARQIVKTVVDTSEQNKIQLDVAYDETAYDESNPLVLPSKKRKTKKLPNRNAAPVKILSKKKRKQLEKIVEQKNTKTQREELLASLEKVQTDPEKLELLIPLQAVQTLGRKNYLSGNFVPQKTEVSAVRRREKDGSAVNAIKGFKRLKKSPYGSPLKKRLDIVQDSTSSDDDDSDLDETAKEELKELKSEVNAVVDKEEESVKHELIDVEADDSVKKEEGADGQEAGAKMQEGVSIEQEEKEVKELLIDEIIVDGQVIYDKVRSSKTAINIKNCLVNRALAVQEERLKLPINGEEQVIVEMINSNPVSIVVGPTGSGKTTQVPQFLYEVGYCESGKMIGVTEPRRVAAMAMSRRVAYEMNMSSEEVSYQIRFEGNTTNKTKIKFMTDGVLLKEIQMDPLLKRYSAILIDEAHERSVYSDILIGILSRIVPKRSELSSPMKLVIMSATLRIEDFTENERLFKGIQPPVVQVGSRMFDVTIHFNKRTPDNYMLEAYNKVCKIHRKLPDGGILVFVTGQQEVNSLCRQLSKTFPDSDVKKTNKLTTSAYQRQKEELKELSRRKSPYAHQQSIVLPEIDLSKFSSGVPEVTEGGELVEQEHADDNDGDEDDENFFVDEELNEPEQPLYVLPLYSVLSAEKQQKVFEMPPEGKRLCIIATNVAETSLTIPNVKYVIDTGKFKDKVFDRVTGVSMFHVTWISQASANQRAGRAGRTSPGHCYRLYSSAVFNDTMPPHSLADIQRRPIDDVVLVMKSMNLPVVNFPYPSPPDYVQIRHSVKRLMALGALEEAEESKGEAQNSSPKDRTYITCLGKAMACFPLAPRYAKMIVLSHQQMSVMPYTLTLIAALTVQELLVETPVGLDEKVGDTRQRWYNLRLAWAGEGQSRLLGDLMVLLRAVGTAEYQQADRAWCERNGLRYKALCEIRKLRRQLTNEINLIVPKCGLVMDPFMPPPTVNQCCFLRQIVLAGTVDHIARIVDPDDIRDPTDRPKWKNAYRSTEMEDPIFMPHNCVLKVDKPEWIIFQEIYETTKMFMRGVTVIDPEWLVRFVPQMCTLSAPLTNPPPSYDQVKDSVMCYRNGTFGPLVWPLPQVHVPYPTGKEQCNWFAYFFLSGAVCPKLKKFLPYLYEPKTLISPFAIRFKQQRENFVRALMDHDVTSYKRLEELWSEDRKLLLAEYLAWLDDTSAVPEIERLWPPLRESL